MKKNKKSLKSKRVSFEMVWNITKELILVFSFFLSIFSFCISRNAEEMTRRNNREALKFEALDNVVKTVQNLYVKYVDEGMHPISEEDSSTINDIKSGLDSYLDIERENTSSEYEDVKNKALELEKETIKYLETIKSNGDKKLTESSTDKPMLPNTGRLMDLEKLLREFKLAKRNYISVK